MGRACEKEMSSQQYWYCILQKIEMTLAWLRLHFFRQFAQITILLFIHESSSTVRWIWQQTVSEAVLKGIFSSIMHVMYYRLKQEVVAEHNKLWDHLFIHSFKYKPNGISVSESDA